MKFWVTLVAAKTKLTKEIVRPHLVAAVELWIYSQAGLLQLEPHKSQRSASSVTRLRGKREDGPDEYVISRG